MSTVERADVVRLSGPPGGPGVFAVASRSCPGRVYRVRYADPGIWCPCTGYGFRCACRHADGVIEAVTMERADVAERARVRLLQIAKEFACD
jgi:hypothetical protein